MTRQQAIEYFFDRIRDRILTALTLRRNQNLKTRVAKLKLEKYLSKDYIQNVSLAKINSLTTFV